MKTDVNEVILEGRLVNDAKVTELKNQHIADYSLAVNKVTKKNDTLEEEVSFFHCCSFVTPQMIEAKLLSKGNLVIITGFLKQNRWEKDGKNFQDVKIYTKSLKLLSSKNTNESTETEKELETEFAEDSEIEENYFN